MSVTLYPAAIKGNVEGTYKNLAAVAEASDSNPLMNGVASPGTSEALSREDHVHPTDTSRAPLDSPALTGAPTAPTASAGTNTTQIATTAFAQRAASDIVAIQSAQPTDAQNKLWVDTDGGSGANYQVPTVAEMNAADALSAKADEIGIVITGARPAVAVTAGQYVIVRNSTITGITDGLYINSSGGDLSPSTDVTAADLTSVSNGGFNSLGDKLSKYGKVLWDGNLHGAGSITVPDLDSYAVVGIISGYGYQYMMVGHQARGGMLYGVYRNNTITQLAYRFGYSGNNVLSVSNDDRGITDGTNTTYSGNTNCALIRVIGLIPKN